MTLRLFALVEVEPMTGIEPAYSAWEVGSLRPDASLAVP